MSDFYDIEKKNTLISKSAKVLPDNPSNKGFSADQIKRTMYEPSLLIFKWLAEKDDLDINKFTDIEKKFAEQLNLININKDQIRINGVDIKLNKENIDKIEQALSTLDSEVVKVIAQELTDEQKLQAKKNIGLDKFKTINNESVIGDGNIDLPTNDYVNTTFVKNEKLGKPNGVPTLDENGKIPSSQLSTAGIFLYKGQVATYDDLPKVNNEIGDVYDVLDTGKNYAWNGTTWDDLGGETFNKDWQDKITKNTSDISTINADLKNKTKEITSLQLDKLDKKPIYLPHGTDLYTYNWNDYQNGTYFAGTNFVNLPLEMKDHKDVVIQLIKQNESGRYALLLFHTGVYENNTGVYINFHYSDKFKGWESLIGGNDGITIEDVENLLKTKDYQNETQVNTLIDNKNLIPSAEKGKASGVATLDTDGKIPVEQLPDDHKEVVRGTLNSLMTEFTATDGVVWKSGSENIDTKLFIDNVKNIPYIWSGSKFVATGSNIGFGTVKGTAYEGDKGQANRTDIETLKRNVGTINSALDNKVDKYKEQYVAYATNGLGDQTSIQYNQEPYGGGLAQRTSDGRLKTATPTENNDSVNLEYFNANKPEGGAGDKATVTGTTLEFNQAVNSKVVVANNNEPTTEELKTLKVGEINYSMPAGGGGGGITIDYSKPYSKFIFPQYSNPRLETKLTTGLYLVTIDGFYRITKRTSAVIYFIENTSSVLVVNIVTKTSGNTEKFILEIADDGINTTNVTPSSMTFKELNILFFKIT